MMPSTTHRARIFGALAIAAATLATSLAASDEGPANPSEASTDAVDSGAPAPAPVVPACIQIQTSSRWVPYGYNHIVLLNNGCSRAAACDVSTDVNPERRAVTMAPGEAVEVVTFLGAATSTFTARVDCRLR